MSEQSSEDGCWVGFDLGGTKMFSGVFDSKFELLGKKRRRTKGHEGVESGVDRMIGTIADSLEDAGIGAKQVKGIGIGLPGTMKLDEGILINAPNLGWRDVPIRRTLEKAFGCPAVTMNDVDAGTSGEYRKGAGKGGRCVLGIFPGTGLGGGCVYEGRIIRGKTGSCMEIGHTVFPMGGLWGPVGAPIELEDLTGRLSIAAACAAEAYRGRAPGLMAKVGTDVANIRSKALAEAYRNGDAPVVNAFQRAVDYLSMGIANAVNLLAPDIIVIGGGLSEEMPELYVDALGRGVRTYAMPELTADMKVKAASLGDLAVAIGAATYRADTMEKESKPA